jgi:hypothetical protein
MEKDYRRIEELIERFFEGHTSNEEEQELYIFFSGDNIPEQLLSYCPIFAYFETGIKNEACNLKIINRKKKQLSWNKKIRIWASVAASVLVLLSFGTYYFVQTKENKLYEGSYIIRNGVKITDPKIVVPEIKKTLYLVQQQEKEYYQLFQQILETNQEDPYVQIMNEIKQQQLKWVEQLKDEIAKNEILKLINIEI